MNDVWPTKDPDSVLDFFLDWSKWLNEDTIVASSWSVDVADITIDLTEFTDTISTVWLSGGIPSSRYRLTNRITTAGGRVEERTKTLIVREK